MASYLYPIVLLNIVLSIVFIEGHPDCVKVWKKHARLQVDVFYIFKVDTEDKCYRACWFSSKCRSYNYSPSGRECELSSSTELLSGSNPTVDLKFNYAEIQPTFCQEERHACADRPCQDEEICMPMVRATKHLCLPLESTALTTTSPTTSTTTSATTSTTSTTSATTPTTTSTTSATTSTTSTTSATTSTSATTPTTTSTTSATTSTTTSATTPPTTSSASSTTVGVIVDGGYTYQGCYKYSSQDVLFEPSTQNNEMTHVKCATNYCSGRAFFGMTNVKYCSCSDTLDVDGFDKLQDSECESNCRGADTGRYCGQSWKMAVFENS